MEGDDSAEPARRIIGQIVGQNCFGSDIGHDAFSGFPTLDDRQHRIEFGFESLLDVYRLTRCRRRIQRVQFMPDANVHLCPRLVLTRRKHDPTDRHCQHQAKKEHRHSGMAKQNSRNVGGCQLGIICVRHGVRKGCLAHMEQRSKQKNGSYLS